ncbi:uncharacterized protein UMAG_11774 [Mycosarcoma maydis]|uniref:DUF2306 domain-containing protein n=1 Tax=Mycosarcoma maydis TaxID=5270 RepID=A0A0D1CU42_MYCMD|nr:uncharacterized protein UMAG_11774 [Ustilago maydis 521]KIS69998.1 hypothetical protein UMAG_11774 [Ustilago maydis 521]|eukprot:XP_011388395.1 hypothetical protein UMAG_11774 [Ustilago maydis 521]
MQATWLNSSAKPRRSVSLLRGLVWISVLAYVPLSATYFLASDVTKHRLQDVVLAYVISPSFSYGAGSGNDGHIDTYIGTHSSMLIHSLAGSLSLTLGLSQFSDGFRKAYPKIHRWFGYMYILGGCAFIPLSAINYLLRTGPHQTFSGPAFAQLLWLDAVATALTGFLALHAAIQHKFERHRDLITFNFALMFSAPLLRYGWILLGQFWDETKEFINLIVGVWASGFLSSCAIFYIRTRKARAQRARTPLALSMIVGALASSVFGILFLAAQLETTQWWRPVPLFWSSLPPLMVQYTAFLVLAMVAKDDNSRIYWNTFVLGLFTIPFWASVSFETCRSVFHSDTGTAWYAAVTGGWGSATFFSFLINVYSTTYLVDDRTLTVGYPAAKGLA